jgi:PAS domain S-box-containing protein
MKTNSLTIKILFPVIAFMVILAGFAALRTQWIIKGIITNYHDNVVSEERQELEGILNGELSEEAFLRGVKKRYSKESFVYRVTKGEKVVAECCAFPASAAVNPGGSLDARIGDIFFYGFRFDVKQYGLTIDILKAFPHMVKFKRQLDSTVTIFSVSVLLMIVYLMVVLRKNLIRPINSIMAKVGNGEPALSVNISELDELGDVINNAFAATEIKNVHAKTLHKIAVALNENNTLEQIMDTIVGQSRVLIDAEYSAISLYDEKGNFGKLRVYGLSAEEVIGRVKKLPRGEGILELMKFSMAPVKISDVKTHPAFSGAFPEGHPEIKNFLGYPIFSKEGTPLAALYFANKKAGDFTVEDENMLIAIASDAAVAIQRVRDTEELKRFKKIIESSFDVVVITDKNGNIAYVNPAFTTVTGYTATEVRGRNPNILKSGLHDDSFYGNIWENILAGKPWKGEFVNRKKNGEIYNTSAVIFPVLSDSGEVSNFVSIQRDVTEEKKLYEQLLRAQKMEAIGTLAGGIAHDFNNLLSAVIGYAEIVKDDMSETDPHYKHMSIIEGSAKRGANLAMRILNVTKKEKLEYRVVSLNAIVETTLELLARSIPKNISIDMKLDPLLPSIKAESTQLQQVIMNLAVNARDAMPDGGRLLIETSSVGRESGAAHGLSSPDGFVKLSISDTGSGIEEEIAQKVFDPFFTTKSRGTGTGLGLYIVHSIVTNHGGYVNLYSEPGKGSIFAVYLPASQEGPAEEEPVKEEEMKGTGTVLIIEDEPDVRELTKDVLERLGYSAIAASDGREGIRTYREGKGGIDVVVLDMIMPLMNGTEVFQILKTIDPEVRVVLVSGYSSEGFAGISRLIKSGAKCFVQKPFTQKTLAKAIKEAMKK